MGSGISRNALNYFDLMVNGKLSDRIVHSEGAAPPHRVLLLNWRDPWHPRSGGAELVTLRCLERLALRGWSVEWFSSAYPGATPTENRGGIKYVRRGSQATVHIEAFRYYAGVRDLDVVVDEINTIPFFTPLYFRVAHISLIYQLAQEVWVFEMGPLLGRIGRAAEPLYLRPYRKSPVISISNSSIQSLRDIGLKGKVYLLPLDVDEPITPDLPPKRSHGDVIFVGRVTPSKRIEHAIRAAALLRKSGWTGQLIIAGAGERRYMRRLQNVVSQMKAPVTFLGRVSNGDRGRLMEDASVLWMTSVREGWGLVVTEAARHGTPAVVYRVPGLIDAVQDGATGVVVDPSPEALALGTLKLFNEDYRGFCSRAKARADDLSWDRTADVFESALLETMRSSAVPK